MKIKIEIEAKELELTVDEALKILHTAIEIERRERNGGCSTISPEPRGFVCSRGKYHKGFHIATGSELVYEIWKDG